jgi:hypothetical protein|tara:strand:+ start:4471 stop:4599 length:129 start_codon:yes stop_codon:yes gene_type:complete
MSKNPLQHVQDMFKPKGDVKKVVEAPKEKVARFRKPKSKVKS